MAGEGGRESEGGGVTHLTRSARRVALGGGEVGLEDLGQGRRGVLVLLLGNREGTETAATQWK